VLAEIRIDPSFAYSQAEARARQSSTVIPYPRVGHLAGVALERLLGRCDLGTLAQHLHQRLFAAEWIARQ
jgi:hypothetical protein